MNEFDNWINKCRMDRVDKLCAVDIEGLVYGVSYLVGSNLQKNPIFFLSLSLFQIFIH
jgi:hypothetical protein